MQNILTFIIPVRHPENAKNWALLKSNLRQTAASIAHQTHPGWKAVVVANNDADLPELPAGFEIKRVDFPPNPLYLQGGHDRDAFYDAVRRDKGRRILAGMLHAGEMGYVMVADDDDFVSRRLTDFATENFGANGWYVQGGYIWSGGNVLYRYHDFSRLCGTSHIVRADLYGLPQRFEDADDAYICKMLGSHIFIEDHLKATGTPLAPLPFFGAVYRTGHEGAHSVSQTIFRKYFYQKNVLLNPLRLIRRLFKLRRINARLKEEFLL